MLLTRLLLFDELEKVLTAHIHLIGVGTEYSPPAERSPVNFVRAHPEEAKIEGCTIGTMR